MSDLQEEAADEGSWRGKTLIIPSASWESDVLPDFIHREQRDLKVK